MTFYYILPELHHMKTTIKVSLAAALLFATAASHAIRAPNHAYSSDLDNTKLQYPNSTTTKCGYGSCDSNSKYWSGIWWLENSNNDMVHKNSNQNDGERNELRNGNEFNIKSSSKSLYGYVGQNTVSSYTSVTVAQIHRSVSGSKPVLRLEFYRSGNKYRAQFVETSSGGTYTKPYFSSTGTGDKYFKLKSHASSDEVEAKISSQAEYFDADGWQNESKYYFKSGSYMSDEDGSSEVVFRNWNWN